MDKREFDKMPLAARIKGTRQARKIPSEIFAERAFLSSGSAARSIQSGSSGLSVASLIDVCNALDISPEYLLSDYLSETARMDSEIQHPFLAILEDLSAHDYDMLYHLALYMRDHSLAQD